MSTKRSDCNAAQSNYNMASFLQTTKYNQACSLRMTYGLSLERSRSNDVYLYTTCIVHNISFYKIPEYNDTQLLQVYATSQRQTPAVIYKQLPQNLWFHIHHNSIAKLLELIHKINRQLKVTIFQIFTVNEFKQGIKLLSYTLSRENQVVRNRYSRLLLTSEDRLCAYSRMQRTIDEYDVTMPVAAFAWCHR